MYGIGLLNEINLVKKRQKIFFFLTTSPFDPFCWSFPLWPILLIFIQQNGSKGEVVRKKKITSRSPSFPGHIQIMKSLLISKLYPLIHFKTSLLPTALAWLNSETGSKPGSTVVLFFLLCPLFHWLLLAWERWEWKELKSFSSTGEISDCHLSFWLSGGGSFQQLTFSFLGYLCRYFGDFPLLEVSHLIASYWHFPFSIFTPPLL